MYKFHLGIGLYSFLSYHVDVYLIRGPADRFFGVAADDTFHTACIGVWIRASCSLDGIAICEARDQRIPAIGIGVLEFISIARIGFPPNIRYDYPVVDRAAEESTEKLSG